MFRALLWVSAAGLVISFQWGCEEGGSGPTASRSGAASSSGGGTAPLPPLSAEGSTVGERPAPGEQPPTGPPSETGQPGEMVPGSPTAAPQPGGTPGVPPGYVEEGYGAPYTPEQERPTTTPGSPGVANRPAGPPDLVGPPPGRQGPPYGPPREGTVNEGYGPTQGPTGPTAEPPAAHVAFQPRSPEEARSAENLKRIIQALLAYERQHGAFPAAATHLQGTRGLSWRVELLPYLGLQDLYQRFNRNEPWDSAQNKALAAQVPDVYRTPGIAAEGKTCYLAPIGSGTVLNEYGGQGRGAITDGTSNTAVVVEADAEKAVEWTQPEDLKLIPALPTSGLGNLRGDGFLAAMADGSIRRISTKMGANSVYALFTANGGERVELASVSGQPGAEGPEAVAEKRLLDRARESLAAGYANDAHQFLLAAAAGGDVEVLGHVRWSEALGRPALALRWGVGIVTEEAPGNRGGEPGPGVAPQGYPMMPGYGQGSGWAQAVRSTAGSLGDDLVEQLESVKSNEQLDGWLVTAPAAEGDQRGASPARFGEPAFVGSGNDETLTQKALEEGLDVLVALEASTRSGGSERYGGGQSKLVVRIMDVTKGTKGRRLWNSRPMDIGSGSAPYAGEAYGERPAKKTRDTGDRSNRYLEGIPRQLERVLKLEDMPELTDTQLNNRVVVLTNQKQDNPLPALMELRYLAGKGLLAEDKFAEACIAVLKGEDGAKFAAGSPEERLAAIQRWLPEPKAPKPSGPPGYGPPGMGPGTGFVPQEGPPREEMPVEGMPREGFPREKVPAEGPPPRLDSRGLPDS